MRTFLCASVPLCLCALGLNAGGGSTDSVDRDGVCAVQVLIPGR